MTRRSAFAYVCDRSIGLDATHRFRDDVHAESTRTLAAVSSNFIYRAGMKTWAMEIDPVDDRYLLVGTAKSNVLLYDLHALDGNDNASATTTYNTSNPLAPVCSARASSRKRPAHSSSALSPAPLLQFGVSAVDWYPIDGGLFITSSLDGCVRVWDSETFATVSDFALPSKVFRAAFSRIARSHTLIAAATANGDVRLCDLATSASQHSLLGHTDEIWSLAWSLTNEHQLATGSRNGEIRLWDVRRAGSTACLLCLNRDGAAAAPGRASVHTNVVRQPTLSLAAAAQSNKAKKRQRVADTAYALGTVSAVAMRIANNRVAVRDATHQQQQQQQQQQQRRNNNDPHAAASTSFVSAHVGGVTSLVYTPDGRYLLSSATDQRLRLWHSTNGAHMFANYEGVQSHVVARGVQMAIVQEADAASSTLVFHPNGRDGELVAYDVFGDRGVPVLRSTAHYEQISACVYRRTVRELWTGGEDGLIMKWRPAVPTFGGDESADSSSNAAVARDVDTWSDDDDDDVDDGEDGTTNVFIPPILQQQL